MTTNEDFSKKCLVLAKFWTAHKNDPEMRELIEYHNLGFPLAYMQVQGLSISTDEGNNYIEDTFEDLVTMAKNDEKHSELITKFLSEELITVGTDLKVVECGNGNCDNKAAPVDEVCGNFISISDEKCDYFNYSIAKPMYSLVLEYEWSAPPEDLKVEVIELEEIIVDLSDIDSERDLTEYVLDTCGSEYGDLVDGYVSSMLVSWRSTFGIQSELNPNLNLIEGPRFGSFELTLDDDVLQVAIVITMYLKSHQHDMLEWYPKSLAESLMDEDDLVWVHEGHRITLSAVEIG